MSSAEQAPQHSARYAWLEDAFRRVGRQAMEELDRRQIADALTEILRNSAFWTFYRQPGSFVDTGSKCPYSRQSSQNLQGYEARAHGLALTAFEMELPASVRVV